MQQETENQTVETGKQSKEILPVKKTSVKKKGQETGIDDKEQEFKDIETGKKEDNAPVTLQHTNTTGEFYLSLESLLSLRKSGIQDAELAMRTINKKHLAGLIRGNDEDMPPIKVQGSNKGFLIIDGYHRYTRALILAARQFKLEKTGIDIFDLDVDFTDMDEIKAALQQGVNVSEQDAYVAKWRIKCIALNCKSYEDVLNEAFKANLKHGLPTSDKTKIRYAVWLHTHKGLSQRKAADAVGLSKTAIQHFLASKKRDEEKLEKGETTPQEVAEKQSAEQSEKRNRTFATALRNAWEEAKPEATEDAADYLCGFFKAQDIPAISGMIEVLKVALEMLREEA